MKRGMEPIPSGICSTRMKLWPSGVRTSVAMKHCKSRFRMPASCDCLLFFAVDFDIVYCAGRFLHGVAAPTHKCGARVRGLRSACALSSTDCRAARSLRLSPLIHKRKGGERMSDYEMIMIQLTVLSLVVGLLVALFKKDK